MSQVENEHEGFVFCLLLLFFLHNIFYRKPQVCNRYVLTWDCLCQQLKMKIIQINISNLSFSKFAKRQSFLSSKELACINNIIGQASSKERYFETSKLLLHINGDLSYVFSLAFLIAVSFILCLFRVVRRC